MINRCSAQKFVIVELCDTVLIDMIHLANYEFFSSMFKDVSVYGNNRYPPTKDNGWELVTRFEARNVREVQVSVHYTFSSYRNSK